MRPAADHQAGGTSKRHFCRAGVSEVDSSARGLCDAVAPYGEGLPALHAVRASAGLLPV